MVSAPLVSKKIAKRSPPLVIFGITFGESSFLDYEPNTKLKVKQNDLLVFLSPNVRYAKSGVPLGQGLELLAENMTNKNLELAYMIFLENLAEEKIYQVVFRLIQEYLLLLRWA